MRKKGFRYIWLMLVLISLELDAQTAGTQSATTQNGTTQYAAIQNIAAPNASYYDIMHDIGLIQKTLNTDSGQYVSCSFTILHSMESTPNQFLDSLNGQYYATGNLRYSRLANTETIQNDSMGLTLYNDDKLIVAVPKKVNAGNQSSQWGLMITGMDSSFISKNADSVKITAKGNQKTMTFYFTSDSRYYNGVLIYSVSSYVPISMSYILKQTKYHETGKPVPDGNIITFQFGNYTTAPFDPSFLNVNKYIQTSANGKASIQAAYQSYNVLQQGQLTNSSIPN